MEFSELKAGFSGVVFVFASWLAVYVCYYFGHHLAKQEPAPRKRGEIITNLFENTGRVVFYLVVAMLIFGMFDFGGWRLFSPVGFLQALVVISISGSIGVWHGIREQRKIELLKNKSSNDAESHNSSPD